jgi:3-oxoacyl-[acyl-carrier-protein] synthase-3
VQHKIGAVNAGAFDLAAACSGFVYSLASAWGYVSGGIYRNILVIGADHLSAFTDYTDRGSCILFGDGAGAVILQADTDTHRGILTCELGSDGSMADMMTVFAGGSQCRTSEETVKARKHYMTIRGREVFKFAANKMQELVKSSLEKCNLTIDDVKLVVPHQVNSRILDFAAEKMGLPPEKMFVNIDRYGNTSAASVPIALDEANRKGLLQKGDILVLVAFGGGLTWASMVLRW